MDKTVEEKLLNLFEANALRRAKARDELMGNLTEREQRLVREAVIAGYLAHAIHRPESIPPDSEILASGLDVALGYSDLYPLLTEYKPGED